MNYIKNIKDKLKNNIIYVLIFTLLIVSFVIYKDFLTFKKLYLYVDAGSDTVDSYWPFYKYVVESIKDGSIGFWMFNSGIGNSILTYGSLLPDPFILVFLIFGVNKIQYALIVVAVAKIILSGIFFYCYFRYMKMSKYTCYISSVIYAFNGYIILWGQHYQFANVIVILPLLMLSYEKWFKENNYKMMILTVFCFATYSSYFFYMASIFLFLYALFRYIEDRKFHIKEFIIYFLKSIFIYFIGLGLSAIIFLPSCYVILNSYRVSASLPKMNVFKLNDLLYYITTCLRFFSNDMLRINGGYVGAVNYYEAPILYSSLVVILLIPQFYKLTDYSRKIKYGILNVILIMFIIFPFFSSMFNLFSTVAYRWTFIIIFFNIVLFGKSIELIVNKGYVDKQLMQKTTNFLLIILFSCLLLGCFKYGWNNEISLNILIKFLVFIISMISLYNLIFQHLLNKKTMVTFYVCLSLVISTELAVSSWITVNKRNIVTPDYITTKQGYFDYTNEALQYIKNLDNELYRIDKSYNSRFLSDSLMQNYNGLNSYNSLNQQGYVEFLKGMDALTNPNLIYNVGDRLNIQTLLGVKYYLVKGNGNIPFGYEYLKNFNDVSIYKNKYSLPIGFVYDKYIDYDVFTKLNSYQKDKIITRGFISEDVNKFKNRYERLSKIDMSNINTININLPTNDKISTFNCNNIVNKFPKSFEFSSTNLDPNIIFPVKFRANSKFKNNVYVEMEIKSNIDTIGEIFWKNSNEEFSANNSKNFVVSKGENNYLIDLGNINFDNLRLDVSNSIGNFEIKNYKMYVKYEEMDDYKEDIKCLATNKFNIKSYKNDKIIGDINSQKDGMLFLSIPYDKGWHIKVDGKKATIQKINLGFMGTEIEKGYHQIELSFSPPWMKQGIIVTIISIIIFTILQFREIYIKKKKENEIGKF